AEAKAVGQWIVNYAMTNPEFRNSETWSNFVHADLQFQQWAINFLNQNPNTTWTQFENWFMGTSEGKAGEDYDASYWEDPNLTFPQQNLPSWQDYYNAFPKDANGKGLSGPAIYELVKGTPKALRDGVLNDNDPNNDEDYDNACALRVSRALNYSGIVIPYLPNQTFKGGDGKYYFLSAKKLNAWMRKTFGTKPANPNHIHITGTQAGQNGKNLPNLLKDQNLSLPNNPVYYKGIYSLVSSNPNWASGHADILQPNGICINGCHFYDAPIAYIDVWILQ
ncbi:MAG: T6SS effector amidase Tae4 family protein, partial [Bergeyella sp.]